jgi:nucleotide-binding universal stress UspA family protein
MYTKILAPLDGSKLSECSLEHIKEIATGCHVREVILLTVLEQFSPIFAEYSNLTQIEAKTQEKEVEEKRARETAELYLEKTDEKLNKQGISVQNVLIQPEENQTVAEIILNYANNNNIDLIVMSTHGRSGITRWAFGSVADRVLRYSKVPVLTVVPAGCRKETV